MRSAPSLVAVASIALLTSTSAVAKDGPTISVLELRSHVHGDFEVGRLTERVRDAARSISADSKVLPSQELFVLADTCSEDCDLAAARDQGADLVASGELTSGNPGFRVSLLLRQVRSGNVVARASAAASKLEELNEAVSAAASDLFRAQRSNAASAVVAVDALALPDLPALPAVVEGGAVNLSVDANVLVAYDRARTIELKGKERPDDAAYAWEAVANADGENPYRALATDRAKSWRAFADNKHAFESQLARDTARLRKVLPLGSVTDAVKLELLTRYSRAYGASKTTVMLPYVPMGPLRDKAALVIGCDSSDPGKCLALARFAAEQKDDKGAADYLDRACAAGAFAACTDAAAAFAADPVRATAALQKGCEGGDGKSCAQLAREYETGAAGKVDAALASTFREKACSAGDGKSCRKLAAAVDTGDDVADQRRANELWRKGCVGGDATSCSLARMTSPQTPARAAIIGAVPASTVAPAAAPPAPAAAPAQPSTSAPASKPLQLTPMPQSAQKQHDATAGGVLIGVGVLAAGGAFFAASQNDASNARSFGRTGLSESHSQHINMVPVLGAAALLTGITGIALIVHSRAEDKPVSAADTVAVGVSPAGLTLSGKLP
jgi:TPR repeat protein